MRTWSLRLLRQLFRLALSALHMLAAAASAAFKSRAALQLENLALRHQLGVLRRSVKRPKLTVSRSTPLGVAVRVLDRLAICPGHRQAGNRHWLAPQGLPAVLDMESSSRPTWAPTGVERNSPTDSQDEPRESTLGRTPHPRRIAQTRHRYRRDQRGQVHGTQSEAAVANLADLPGESRQDHGVGRLLHRADDPVSGPVRVPGSGSRPKADRAFQRHRPSHGRVDRAATPGGLSL